MKVRILLVAIFCLLLLIGGAVGWTQYRHLRAAYDAYRALIQPGVRVAGVEAGWLTPDQARQKVWEWVAAPYYRPFTLHYQDQVLSLSPGDDLGLVIPVDEMVAEAVAASHRYDDWQGFKSWIRGQAIPLDLDIPFRLTFDQSAAARFLEKVAQAHDIEAVEPMINVQTATFFPGRPGRRLEIEAAAATINSLVADPTRRQVTLPVEIVPPDQSPARIESMLSTLVPVMERPPTPPRFYTATLPISTTGGIEGTPVVSYTGPLTWTFPHFAGYKGTLTTTYAYLFEPGRPGYTFNLTRATSLVELSLRAGVTRPITFEPDLVPPPPITPGLLLPPLKARLAQFPGVSSLLVKNLDTDQVIYESNVDDVLSGMSIVKIGIMVEVYRYYGGQVDAQTHQELLDMLGSSSCNPCANRLLAAVGGGSAYEGARKVTDTMHRLGLANFYLCAPFRLEARQHPEGPVVWAAGPAIWPSAGFWLPQAETPRYDRCVRATPREMANLLEMIYRCTQDQGPLRRLYPNVITPTVCQDMIEIMAANDLRNMLGAGIPPEVRLAHKHGFAGYDVPWGDTRGEVGIVFSPGATWLISFYIWQDSPWIDFGIVQPLYRDVSNLLYNYFNPNAPFWPQPPWTPPPPEKGSESGT